MESTQHSEESKENFKCWSRLEISNTLSELPKSVRNDVWISLRRFDRWKFSKYLASSKWKRFVSDEMNVKSSPIYWHVDNGLLQNNNGPLSFQVRCVLRVAVACFYYLLLKRQIHYSRKSTNRIFFTLDRPSLQWEKSCGVLQHLTNMTQRSTPAKGWPIRHRYIP